MPFTFIKMSIPDLIKIKPKVFEDERGFFMETYKRSDFYKHGIKTDFIQENHSYSKKNVIRGLHYQIGSYAQGKLVKVVKGRVWDVAVDIRRSSPTFMKWVGVELSETDGCMLFMPPGFAHGFAALSDEVHFLYKCTNEYNSEAERSILWNDPNINISWPVQDPIISKKDSESHLLSDAELFE